jgi:hypothetical protein
MRFASDSFLASFSRSTSKSFAHLSFLDDCHRDLELTLTTARFVFLRSHKQQETTMSGTTTMRAPKKRKAASAALVAIQNIKVTEEEDDVLVVDAKASSGGRHVHFGIGGVALPEELACHILGFVPKTDLVHSISLVSTLWNDLSKSSVLWQTLDFSDLKQSKKSKKGIINMGRLLKLLQRPQFASLKCLGFPDIYRTMSRQVFPNISKACPLLEEIDCATVHDEETIGVRPHSDEMTNLPAIFPNLKKISLEMIFFDCNSLEQFVKAMDGRLVGLNLLASRDSRGQDWRRNQCLDATLETIGRHCPNLTSFRYGFHWDFQEDDFEETVTEKGIIALLRACPKLKVCTCCGTVLSSVSTRHQTIFSHTTHAPVVFRIWN